MKTRKGQGISTLVNHRGEHISDLNAHVTPIYQTSTFSFDSVAQSADLFADRASGFFYTRCSNPNQLQLAEKIAALEAYDFCQAEPDRPLEDFAAGLVFSSGMAAVLTTLLASATAGQTILAQESLYSATYGFMTEMARRYQIQTVLVPDIDPQAWEDAFAAHPDAVLAYAETPANPTMQLSDLAAIAQIAHRAGAKLAVDNTFASPYCQRPLSLGADIVLHSTTKYLNGHGTTIGGAVVARDAAWVRGGLLQMQEMLGGSASPFDSWLTNLGLRTFELRMQRHCANAAQIAAFLENHPAVARVNYPGLESFAQHELARRQMLHYGGMLSFELKGGLEAGARMMDRMQVCTLAVSLGNVDTLIEHPASMTHNSVPAEARQKIGITDGLVRLSVGIENVEDLLVDLDQAMGG